MNISAEQALPEDGAVIVRDRMPLSPAEKIVKVCNSIPPKEWIKAKGVFVTVNVAQRRIVDADNSRAALFERLVERNDAGECHVVPSKFTSPDRQRKAK